MKLVDFRAHKRLTKQFGPISSGHSEQLFLATGVKPDILGDIVHFTVKRRPRIRFRVMLFQLFHGHSEVASAEWIQGRAWNPTEILTA